MATAAVLVVDGGWRVQGARNHHRTHRCRHRLRHCAITCPDRGGWHGYGHQHDPCKQRHHSHNARGTNAAHGGRTRHACKHISVSSSAQRSWRHCRPDKQWRRMPGSIDSGVGPDCLHHGYCGCPGPSECRCIALQQITHSVLQPIDVR
jgi:hypothetical protein